MDCICLRGMERQRNHGLHLIEGDVDHAVIISHLAGLEFLERFGPAIYIIIMFNLLIRFPDGGEAGGFGGHNVDAVAEFHGQVRNAGAYELKHFILYEAAFKRCRNKRKRNVMRADALLRCASEVHKHNFGRRYIVSVFKELLYKLGAAFANAHGAKRAIAGMAIGAEDHAAAGCKRLAGVAVDDALVRRHIDAAIFFRCRKAEHVVILIDRAANGAKAVMAVGHGIGQREFLEPACARSLDDAHIGDVVRNEAIELDAHLLGIIGYIVRAEDGIRDGVFARRIGARAHRRAFLRLAVHEVYAVGGQLDHGFLLLLK